MHVNKWHKILCAFLLKHIERRDFSRTIPVPRRLSGDVKGRDCLWLFSYHKLHYGITKMLSTASCKVFAHLAFRFRFACHRTGRGNILMQRWKMTWQSSCGFAFRFPTFHFGPDQEQSRTDPCLVSVSGTMEEVELAVRQIRCLHQKQRPFGLDNSIYSLESRTLLQDFDSL